MLITMHVALLAFYFNMLIYVEIDVCVVPNWSYVMICERRFNLKTTCVKKKYLWLIFYLYIWHKFVLFRLVFVSSFAEPSQLGWTGLLNVGSISGKLISTYSFFFFLNLQCEIIETRNAHVWLVRILFLLREILFGPNDPEGLDPAFETQHTKNVDESSDDSAKIQQRYFILGWFLR